jgi:hypothetical protein
MVRRHRGRIGEVTTTDAWPQPSLAVNLGTTSGTIGMVTIWALIMVVIVYMIFKKRK